MSNDKYTPEQVIERYLLIRQRKREIDAEYKEKLAELQGLLDMMEKYLLLAMSERKEIQIKTERGTAYQVPEMRVQMVDRPALVGSILNDVVEIGQGCDTVEELYVQASPLFDVFTSHVSKDAVRAMLDKNINPVGIEVTRFIGCTVRKA